MAQSIRDIMTADPRTVEPDATLADAAKAMAQGDIGAVLVTEQGRVTGILTDRDIVVRAVAEGRDPSTTKVAAVCSSDPVTLTVDQTVEDAIRVVHDHDVRRIPIVEDGRAAGVVSIGDLAMERDAGPALADISAAPANN
jgi:CBS domain-containing protein